MRRKSRNYSGKKKNGQSKAKKIKTSAEDVPTTLINASLPVLPVEHSKELSAEGPSTSHDTPQGAIALLKPEELQIITQKVNLLLDKCFQDKSEIVVDRRLFEDMVSETLEHFYSQEDKCKNITEAKHLTEKCKALQTEQIKLNRQRYALKKQVEDAKHIIKKMVDEKHLFDHGIYRKVPLGSMTRKVRSVGLQVCLIGPMFISKPVITYNPVVFSQLSKSISPPPEQRRTARKRTVNKDISVRKNSEPRKAKVTQSANNNKAPPKKDKPSEIKLNVTTRRMSAESANNSRAPTKKENPSGNNTNVTNRRMSTRNKKIVEVEQPKPTSSVKVKSSKDLNNGNKIVKQIEQRKKSDKGFGNALIIKEEKFDEVVIKEEVIEESIYDVVEISEDEEIEETIIETKDVLKVHDRKEAGVQVNVDNTNENVNNMKENVCSKINEIPSNQGAEPLIKVRSPEFINKHLIKSLNPSSCAPEGEKLAFCQLPKYPMSPKYPPNVSKPPAPILQVGKKDNPETQGVMLTWSFACKKPENIVEYQLFVYQERSCRNPSNDWKKVGDIKALPLPMACFLSQFIEGETYHFIVRAVDSHRRLGDFSIPAGIKLQPLDPSIKTPVGTIFKAPLPKNNF